jgi:hypothetical protein
VFKFKFRLYCDRRSVGQFVLVSGPLSGRWPDFKFLWVTVTFFLLHVGRPFWREDGSVICSEITHRLESRRTHNHILLSHLRRPSMAVSDSVYSLKSNRTEKTPFLIVLLLLCFSVVTDNSLSNRYNEWLPLSIIISQYYGSLKVNIWPGNGDFKRSSWIPWFIILQWLRSFLCLLFQIYISKSLAIQSYVTCVVDKMSSFKGEITIFR